MRSQRVLLHHSSQTKIEWLALLTSQGLLETWSGCSCPGGATWTREWVSLAHGWKRREHHMQIKVMLSLEQWAGGKKGSKWVEKRPKMGIKTLLLLANIPWFPEKLEIGTREEGDCGMEWHSDRLTRAATEAGVTLACLQIQAYHFLFTHYLCDLKQSNFFRNKMNFTAVSHLRGHLWGHKEIMFARGLSPCPGHNGHSGVAGDSSGILAAAEESCPSS